MSSANRRRRVTGSGTGTEKADRKLYISNALVGERVGLREIENRRWLLTFLDIDLGVVDKSEHSFEPKQQEAA